MERRRRIGAYGVCRDDQGRVLLVRAAEKASVNRGRWLLPGGGVEHGEHPAQAVVREFAEETGLRVEVVGLRDVLSDIDQVPDPALRHHDRLIYDVRATGGRLSAEYGAAWFAPADLAEIELVGHTAAVLERPLTDAVQTDRDQARRAHETAPPAPVGPVPARRQRFAAYGLITNAAGDVLLTLISPGYPGAGSWHLPGGGTDFGESARSALLREIVEETDQRAELTALLGASHRRHSSAVGPERVPIDFHGVRVVYRGTVAAPTQPRVMEESGSTIAAAWYPPSQALQLPLTEIAREHIARELAS